LRVFDAKRKWSALAIPGGAEFGPAKLRNRQTEKLPLYRAISLLKGQQCSMPHDHIYGLLGLVKDPPHIENKYEISFLDLLGIAASEGMRRIYSDTKEECLKNNCVVNITGWSSPMHFCERYAEILRSLAYSASVHPDELDRRIYPTSYELQARWDEDKYALPKGN
jgi:hypothetical protein